jgi:carboxyl-terminal processing protease
VLTDWGTQYAKAHPTLPPVGTFAVTDADFEQLKSMARAADFKYDRLSEKRLDDLKKMMEFEGYYDDATDEFKALEQKLTHNMDRDFDRRRDDIKELMEQEVIKRYYYQRGSVQQALRRDDDFERACQLLSDPAEYQHILHP